MLFLGRPALRRALSLGRPSLRGTLSLGRPSLRGTLSLGRPSLWGTLSLGGTSHFLKALEPAFNLGEALLESSQEVAQLCLTFVAIAVSLAVVAVMFSFAVVAIAVSFAVVAVMFFFTVISFTRFPAATFPGFSFCFRSGSLVPVAGTFAFVMVGPTRQGQCSEEREDEQIFHGVMVMVG